MGEMSIKAHVNYYVSMNSSQFSRAPKAVNLMYAGASKAVNLMYAGASKAVNLMYAGASMSGSVFITNCWRLAWLPGHAYHMHAFGK